ncbi:hypothetical protein ACO0LB_18020 [Undibacterium sp. SXout7W]|uniref:hypothetical protein n=1 Tax=Undibacterium sp. SXout7W TaxID=3413049 RepID=UPI003BF45D45
MRHLQALSEAAKEQLSDGLSGNFFAQAKSAKLKISRALATENVLEARSAAAAYGGLVKRWRRWLIEEITDATLMDVDTSREKVRSWQSQVFGQAVASERLSKYGRPERSGGGRSEAITLPDGFEDAAERFYKRYAEKIKQL